MGGICTLNYIKRAYINNPKFFFTKIEILLQFVELTCTDEMLAQFYLQDRDWNVERSVQAYFDEKTAKTEASRFADAIYLLL